MFPGSAKFQTRSSSPQFSKFSPSDEYPESDGASPVHQQHQQQQHQMPYQQQQAQQQQKLLQHHQIQFHSEPHHSQQQHYSNHQQQLVGIHGATLGHHHHPQQQQQHQQQQNSTSMSMRLSKTNMSMKTRSQSGHHLVNSSNSAISQCPSSNGLLAQHHQQQLQHQQLSHRNDLLFSDDLDSIEFCMPPAPANGLNGDMMLMHGQNDGGMCEAFSERRRRGGHSRRSNHKIDVEQQVKWSRKNIAATMERFEPTTHHSSSSASSLEYGFAASVVSPLGTPSHHPQQSFNMNSAHNNGHNNIYSYAYYEPGAIKCHTNIPHGDEPPVPPIAINATKTPPSRNSIRALLAKGFRSKSRNGQSTSSSPSQDDRHTYTTRYGTTENLYEEVNDQKIRKVLSDNRIAQDVQMNVKEELRRVQQNHFRVLDELNLSLEALIMPPTPPDISPNHRDEDDEPTTSAGAASLNTKSVTLNMGSQRIKKGGLLGGASSAATASVPHPNLSHTSLENLSTTLNSMELKDHAHSSCINPDFDEGDLDSGFSGSGSSSGASYNESLRYYKTGNNLHIHTTTLPHNLRSCRSSTASGTSTSKSSMASSDEHSMAMMSGMMNGCGATAATVGTAMLPSPFDYARRCSDTQRASARSLSASSATGAKPKKNFWTIKP